MLETIVGSHFLILQEQLFLAFVNGSYCYVSSLRELFYQALLVLEKLILQEQLFLAFVNGSYCYI